MSWCGTSRAELGLGYVRARLPIARAAWYHSSAKARDTWGYNPRRTVFRHG